MLKMIAGIALIEISGIVGYIFVAKSDGGMIGRYLPLMLAVLLVVFFAFSRAKSLSQREIAVISISTAAVFVVLFEVLAFLFYKGLAHDTDFVSLENLEGICKLLVIGSVGHWSLLSLARFIRRLRSDRPEYD